MRKFTIQLTILGVLAPKNVPHSCWLLKTILVKSKSVHFQLSHWRQHSGRTVDSSSPSLGFESSRYNSQHVNVIKLFLGVIYATIGVFLIILTEIQTVVAQLCKNMQHSQKIVVQLCQIYIAPHHHQVPCPAVTGGTRSEKMLNFFLYYYSLKLFFL